MINVILEGPDNAGKTTLAKSIITSIPGISYHHPGGKPKDDKEELWCMSNQQEILNSGPLHLIDRITCISQQIYNPDDVWNKIRKQARNIMLQSNPVIIYCRPSIDKLMRTDEFTWREGESEEHKQKIITNQHEFIKRYDSMMLDIPHIAYNYEETSNANLIITNILRAYQGLELSTTWLRAIMNIKMGK